LYIGSLTMFWSSDE